jgi:hypothetical protein
MSAISSMLGNAVQTRIGYRQCECGRRKCRHDRKMERKIQKHVENQRVRKEIQEQLRGTGQ